MKKSGYDYNLAVIGAGSAGLVTAYIASQVRARVLLVERDKMGGDCLNHGCVPSKALIRVARLAHDIRNAKDFGIRATLSDVDFPAVMKRVHDVIQTIAPHDSVERYTSLGVECMQGDAVLTGPNALRIGDTEVTAKHIVIATGARPFVPPIPGIEDAKPLTSDNLWELQELPERLVVLGGGPIGSELSQAFARLGSQVTQVEKGERIMPREDPDVSQLIQERFAAEGIQLLTGTNAERVESSNGVHELVCSQGGKEVRVPFDRILVAVGRRPNIKGIGLEELGIALSDRGTIETDAYLRTNVDSVFCAGDVAGPYQFTHTASHQAWYAAVNTLFGCLKKFPVDYRVIPWATFTEPEVARVGLNETDAREQNIPFETTIYDLKGQDRAVCEGENKGFLKILTPPGKDRILGATLVGPHAGDVIAEFVLAMKQNIGLNKILGTIHIYPTLAECLKAGAGEWKKAHVPKGIMGFLPKFHAWRRG